jgi:predicted esterase
MRFLSALALLLFAPAAFAQGGPPPPPDATRQSTPSESIGSKSDEPAGNEPADGEPGRSSTLDGLGDEPEAAPVVDAAEVRKLEQRLAALRQQTAADPQNAALLRFKIEQVALCLDVLSERYRGRTLYSKASVARVAPMFLARGEEVARARGDAVFPALSALHERAYIARNDGSAQPYWVFVPRDYSPQKKYGLALFLHGYSPDISKINPWLPDFSAVEGAHRAGMLLAIPYGRRNTDFVDAGEDDVLQVLEEMQKEYPIDADRVLLIGPSMGGFGAWAAGLHRPDLWAGIAPMAARTDFYLWFKTTRESLPAWKRLGFDADDPRTLAANASNVPIFFQHGALDAIVPAEHSRRMTRDLKDLGIAHTYREIPFGDHYIYFYDGAYDAAYEWAAPLRRPPAPARVRYTSGNARNDGAYWVRILDRPDYSQLSHIDARIEAPPQAAGKYLLRVTTQNVAAFALSPPKALLPATAQWTLQVNGREEKAARAADGSVSWRDAAHPNRAEWPQSKSPRRSGPIKNAWRDPFLVVYGTRGPQVLVGGQPQNLDEVRARRWAAQWDDYADGTPRLKADHEVSAAERGLFNLVLFGTEESNALLAEHAGKLPLRWTRQGVRVGSGADAGLHSHNAAVAPPAAPREELGLDGRPIRKPPPTADELAVAAEPRELGLAFCYASPWSAERVIVVQSGPLWGAHLPWNHRWDLLPDWAVFAPDPDPLDSTNRTLAAGFFNRNWELVDEAPADVKPAPAKPVEVAAPDAAP